MELRIDDEAKGKDHLSAIADSKEIKCWVEHLGWITQDLNHQDTGWCKILFMGKTKKEFSNAKVEIIYNHELLYETTLWSEVKKGEEVEVIYSLVK